MTKALRTVAARGVLWTGAAQVARQLVQIVGSIVLAKLLVPDDFGLLGMAMFFVGIAQVIADWGIGSAIVQARVYDRLALSSCFWLNLAIACALAVVIVAASPLISQFYLRDDIASVTAVLSLNLLVAGLVVVPQSLLYRDMRFGVLARAQIIGSLSGMATAITLAVSGAGVWSLVAQPLVGSAAVLLTYLWAVRWVPQLAFSRTRVAHLARFSLPLFGASVVGYGNRNIDSLIVGRYLGAGSLGLYAMAVQVMLYPLQQVSSVIVRVLFPTLVQLQDDSVRLRSFYLKAVATIAFITFPMMGGIYAVADDFVLVVLGEKWSGMTPVVKVFAWLGMIQSVGTTTGTIYLTVGRPDLAFRMTLLSAPLLIGGMAAGLPWGIIGVSIGYAAASIALFYYVAPVAFKLIDLPLREFHRVLIRPLVATLVMVTVVKAAQGAGAWPDVAMRLAACIAVGVAAYCLCTLLFNRGQVMELRDVLSSLVQRRDDRTP